MQKKDWKKEIFTIPNVMSLFRLALIPVYITIFLNADSAYDYFLAASILAVSCLTDLIDGKIARHFNMVSTVGKILDPLADKVTQFTLILCLSQKYRELWLLVALFLTKEMFQLIAGLINLKKGIMLKGALLSGKISTTVLFITLIFMVMLPNLSDRAVTGLIVTDLIFLLIAFADYLITYVKRDDWFQPILEK